MEEIDTNKILEKLNKELLFMQAKEKQNDGFLEGRIDAYEEIIYIIEKALKKY
jgi:hypothetical protein